MDYRQFDFWGNYEPVVEPFKKPIFKKKLRPTQANGYAARPGTGPSGEKCKTCKYKSAIEIMSGRIFWKCALMKDAWTHGTGSDIRLRSLACAKWEMRGGI